jgi:hypothetical protein
MNPQRIHIAMTKAPSGGFLAVRSRRGLAS